MYRRKKILAYKLSMLEVIVNQERNLNRTSLAKGEKKEKEKKIQTNSSSNNKQKQKEKNNKSSSATTIAPTTKTKV